PGAVECVFGHGQVVLARFERGLVHLDIGAHLVDLFADRPIFELGNLLTARDAVAEPDVDRFDPAADPRHHVDSGLANQIPDDHHVVGDRASPGNAGFDGHGGGTAA